MVFNLIREQALIWRVVERRDEKRRIRGKSGSASKGGPSPSSPPQQRQRNSKLTCWTCGEVGHRSTACPSGRGSTESGGSAGDAKKSDPRTQGQQQRSQGAQQAKGTFAARGGAQQTSRATTDASVVTRAVAPAGEGAQGGGVSDGLPPDPLCPVKELLAGKSTAPVVSSWRAVSPGGKSASMPDGVEIEPRELSCWVDTSVAHAQNPKPCPMKAVLDTDAGLSTITTCLVRKLQAYNPDVRVVEAMQQEHKLRVVDGRELFVKEKTCPVNVAIHTSWGPTVVLRSQRFAIMPGTDDVAVIGSPMLKHLGIDVYKAVEDRTRDGHHHRITSEDSYNVTEARRVTASVSGYRESVSRRGGSKWSIIGFIAAICLGVALMLAVGIGREMVQIPENKMSRNIEPFTMKIADVCERLQTEMNETLPSITVAVPVVISFNVVSDDCMFEEKKNGFEESITGASTQCGSAILSSHNVKTYGQNIENEKITAATQFRDMVGGFTSYRDGVT